MSEIKREPAESFAIDYLNVRSAALGEGMLKAGFRFAGSRQLPDGHLQLDYVSTDDFGTTATVIIKKGEGYKSPAQIAKEDLETNVDTARRKINLVIAEKTEAVSQPSLDALKKALNDGNLEGAKASLVGINNFLMAREDKLFKRQLPQSDDELAGFMNNLKNGQPTSLKIYLGDGGMSRLLLISEAKGLALIITSNSSPEVQKRWAVLEQS